MVSEETLSWFRGMVADTQQRLSGLAALQEDPARFHGRVELDEGIEAVVAPGGTPVGLTLSTRALRLGPDALAAKILLAQRRAAEEANRRYAAAVGALTGFDATALVEHRIDERRVRVASETLGEAGRDIEGRSR
jgi:hypothetical protein